MAKVTAPAEPVFCKLDNQTNEYTLFFPNLPEGQGEMTTWTEKLGHSSANPQTAHFSAPPLHSVAEALFKKYTRQYRGNYALCRRAA